MMYSFAALALVALGNLFVVACAQETLCRCEASFENLYDPRHRHLLQEFHRGLPRDGVPYDYGTAYTIDEGYFVIGGVIVLPDGSNICQSLDHDNRVEARMESFGGRRNLAVGYLEDDSNQQHQHSHALRGNLQVARPGGPRGLKGVMAGAIGNNQRDSTGHFYKERKADGQGMGMKIATAQVIDILISSVQT